MSNRLTLDDYINFFGTQPIETHADGWYYGVRFAVSQAGDDLVVTIAPDNLEFGLEWTQQGQRRLSLSLKMVASWEIVKHGADEYLSVRVNTGPGALCSFEYCIIRLKPSLYVEIDMSWDPGWSPSSSPPLPFGRPIGAAEP